MFYQRNDGPRLIPSIGILKYKMQLFQMDNDCLERELRFSKELGLNSAHLNALQSEIFLRMNEVQNERLA